MNKENSVIIYYDVREDDRFYIDSLLDLGIRLRNARDAVEMKNIMEVDFSLKFDSKKSKFEIMISGKQSGNLENTLNEFISLAGTPTWVFSDKEGYRLVERVLEKYQKTLKNGLLSFLSEVGVVDKKYS